MKNIAILLLVLLISGCGENNSETNPSVSNPSVSNQSVLNTSGGTSTNTSAQNIQAASLYAPCASCHGRNAKYSALQESQIIANFTKKDIIDALKGYQASTRDTAGMGGLMTGQVTGLTDGDINILADYIAYQL